MSSLAEIRDQVFEMEDELLVREIGIMKAYHAIMRATGMVGLPAMLEVAATTGEDLDFVELTVRQAHEVLAQVRRQGL